MQNMDMGDGMCTPAARRIVIFLSLLLSLTGCNRDQETGGVAAIEREVPLTPSGTIVALGDSLTAGLGVEEEEAYPSLLAARLSAEGYHFRVINAGISGETSSGTLSRTQWVVSSLKPDIVILATGANDGMRGIDPALLGDNLDRIISTLKANNVEVVLAGMKMLPNLGPAYALAFEDLYPEAAARHGIDLIPFFLEGVAGEAELNQADQIHPNARGYRIMLQNIYPHVLRLVRKKAPTEPPLD